MDIDIEESFESDTETIIQEIQQYEFMYNKLKSQYRNKARKRRMYDIIAQSTKRFKSGEAVKKKWEYLRGQYVTETKKPNSTWKYFDALRFLKDHVVPRKGVQFSPSEQNNRHIYPATFRPALEIVEQNADVNEKVPSPNQTFIELGIDMNNQVKAEDDSSGEDEGPAQWTVFEKPKQTSSRQQRVEPIKNANVITALSVQQPVQKRSTNIPSISMSIQNQRPINISSTSRQNQQSINAPSALKHNQPVNIPSTSQQNQSTSQQSQQQVLDTAPFMALAQKLNTHLASKRSSAQLFGDYVGKVLDEMDNEKQKKLQLELMQLIVNFQEK